MPVGSGSVQKESARVQTDPGPEPYGDCAEDSCQNRLVSRGDAHDDKSCPDDSEHHSEGTE